MKRNGTNMDTLTQESFTAFCGDMVCACAGFVELWPTRASVWALIDHRITRAGFLFLHRQAIKARDAYQPLVFNRLEITVLDGFVKGHRWAKMLGFVPEGLMHHYDQWGRNHTLYARVRV